jgi:hypothetical protein
VHLSPESLYIVLMSSINIQVKFKMFFRNIVFWGVISFSLLYFSCNFSSVFFFIITRSWFVLKIFHGIRELEWIVRNYSNIVLQFFKD